MNLNTHFEMDLNQHFKNKNDNHFFAPGGMDYLCVF